MSFSAVELEVVTPRLRRYAHALARHPVRADDLVQDTLERAWSRRSRFRPGSDLRAWVFTLMHHTFVSELRRAARGPWLADGLDDDGDPRPVGDPGASQPGTMLDIERALGALPIEQRAVLLLVGLEDLSYREAAEVLGIPVGTVMSRLARGRVRLRALMDGRAAGQAPAGVPVDAVTSLKLVR